MLILMMSLSILTPLLFTMMSHPLSMGLTLLMQTVVISMITGAMYHTFWFSYIMFLIMVGGMLVLFIYMTSIASNEKIKISNLMLLIPLPLMLIYLLIYSNDSIKLLITKTNVYSLSESIPLSKFFNFPSSSILLMMIIYLLITLIAVVKISNTKYGPLRQKK